MKLNALLMADGGTRRIETKAGPLTFRTIKVVEWPENGEATEGLLQDEAEVRLVTREGVSDDQRLTPRSVLSLQVIGLGAYADNPRLTAYIVPSAGGAGKSTAVK